MKKVLAILLALTLVLSIGLLAACKKDDEKEEPAAPEYPAQALTEDWITVRFDPEVAQVSYYSVEAKDGSWSIKFSLPTNELGLEMDKGGYNMISQGLGDQKDIVTGEKTLGDYSYQTIRYTQNDKACAYYGCTFDSPKSVLYDSWDGTKAPQEVYGMFIDCTAADSATLDTLEDIIASVNIAEAA